MGKKVTYFKVGFVNHLKNEEFSNLYKGVIRLLDNVEFENEHLISVFENAKNQAVNIKYIANVTSEHPLTKTLKEAAKTRCEHLVSLRHYADASCKAIDLNIVSAGKKVSFWLKFHRRSFSYPGVLSQTHLVHNLVTLMDEQEGVEEALEIIGCKVLFNTIVEETERIAAIHTQREVEIARRKKKVGQKRSDIYGDLRILFTTLENFANMPSAKREMYQRLCLDLVGLIGRYKAVLNSRLTVKRGSGAGEEPDSGVVSNVGEFSVDSDESDDPAENKIADDDAPANVTVNY